MAYLRESEMMPAVRNWASDQGLLVKTEVPNPWGICDLIGCSFDTEKVSERLQLKQRQQIGTAFRVHMLAMIPDEVTNRSISLSKINESLSEFVGHSFVAAELEKLVARRFVRVTRLGNYQKVNGWAPLHSRLITVELKLSRIEEVISQAKANKQLTDYSYIAMPYELAGRIADSSTGREIESLGLGLLATNAQSCVQIVPPQPISSKIDKVAQTHCVERFWPLAIKGRVS